jgi:AAA domain-containing protein
LADFRPLKITRVDSLARATRPESLIDRVLARGSVAVLAAPPYMGKTFLALEAMRSVVEAEPFLGFFPVPRAGNVLYLGNDSPDWDIAAQFDKLIGLPDPKLYDVGRMLDETSLGSYGFIFEPGFMLNTAEDADRVIEAARRQSTVRDLEYRDDDTYYRAVRGTDLIVLDTLRSVHGFEENDNTAMQHVMNLLRYIATSTRASVLALHHFNKSSKETREASLERLRGATAIGGAVDSVFALTGKAPSIAVRVLKHRPFPEQGDFMYEMRSNEDAVTLKVSSSDGVVNLKVKKAILDLLSTAEGWTATATIQEVVAQATGATLKGAASSTKRALAALEKSENIVRVHGAARLATKGEA